MKTHTIEDVREILYALIALHQTTTTLDVKNELRRQGYQAFQDQVSQMVNLVASQDNLAYRNNGKFNVYSYGSDTNETKQVYMEYQQEFWEARVDKKTVTVFKGKILTDGDREQYSFFKNCIAIREVNKWVEEKVQEGFIIATDPRPPLEIRQKYGHLFGRIPISCSIGYFNVIKKEQVSNQILTKSAGYTFTWNLSLSSQELVKVLNNTAWNTMQVRVDQLELLGEKIIQREIAGTSLPRAELQVDNANIFQVELTFEGGEKATFSKFGMDIEKSALPLVKQFLN